MNDDFELWENIVIMILGIAIWAIAIFLISFIK